MVNTVLFTQKKSNYHKLKCLCFGKKEDALNFKKTYPAIYHPPCRSWSRLRGLSKRLPVEHWFALWSLIRVRRYGGILEHPASSLLFNKYIIRPGAGYDEWGGFSVCVDLHWWGFPAVKRTYLYFVGLSIDQLPPFPLNFNAVTHVIGTTAHKSDLKELSKSQRSKTPFSMCEYLLKCLDIIKQNELNS